MADAAGTILTDTTAGAALGTAIPGIGTIIGGLIGLGGGIISSVISSNAAKDQAAATAATNAQNMQLNKQELGISQQNADTQKYSVQQKVRQDTLDAFNKELSSNKDLKNTMYDMWAGK